MGWPQAIMAMVSAAGVLRQANMAEDTANRNADILNQDATTALQQSTARGEAHQRAVEALQGTQRAAIAQAGIGSGGSARDIMEQSAVNAELDAMTMRYEGELRARGFRTEADNQKDIAHRQGSEGLMGAAGSILSSYGDYKVSSALSSPSRG